MGTGRVKQEEETDTRIMEESSKKSGKRNVGTKGKNLKQDLTSAKDLPMRSLGVQKPYMYVFDLYVSEVFIFHNIKFK